MMEAINSVGSRFLTIGDPEWRRIESPVPNDHACRALFCNLGVTQLLSGDVAFSSAAMDPTDNFSKDVERDLAKVGLEMVEVAEIGESNIELLSTKSKHVFKMSRQYMTNIALEINVKVGGRNTVLEDVYLRRIRLISDVPTNIELISTKLRRSSDFVNCAEFNGELVIPTQSARPDQLERFLKARYHDAMTKLRHKLSMLEILTSGDPEWRRIESPVPNESMTMHAGPYSAIGCTRSVSIVPPAYYAHLAACRARYYIEGEISETDSSAGGRGAATRGQPAAVRPLPKIQDNVKDVMFYC